MFTLISVGSNILTLCWNFWPHPRWWNTDDWGGAVALANFDNSYWYQYFCCGLGPSCYTAVCFHIDFASISQLPYMLQGHPSALYQKTELAWCIYQILEDQFENLVAFQLLLVPHQCLIALLVAIHLCNKTWDI